MVKKAQLNLFYRPEPYKPVIRERVSVELDGKIYVFQLCIECEQNFTREPLVCRKCQEEDRWYQ